LGAGSGADLLYFSNRFVAHSRGMISTGARWLQRVFTTPNLDKIRKMTGTMAPTRSFEARQLMMGHSGGACTRYS